MTVAMASALALIAEPPPREFMVGARDPPLVQSDLQIIFDTTQVVASSETAGASVTRALATAQFTVDGERALGWEGGTLHGDLQALWGGSLTDIVGDVQVLDNIDGPSFVGIGELWVEQRLDDDRWRIKIGRMEANDELSAFGLSVSPAHDRLREVFVHSSMGYSPTVPLFSTYPLESLGAMVDWRPHPHVRVAAGVFDGNNRPPLASNYPVPIPAPPFSTVLSMVELGGDWTPARGFDGRVSLGGWALAGELVPCTRADCEPGTDPATGGFYGIWTQVLWRADADGATDRRLASFAQYGWAPPRHRAMTQHAGGGLTLTEPLRGRDDDLIGLGATWVRVEMPAGPGDETVLEAFWEVAVSPYASIQPDLMYTINPGGRGPETLVATLRVLVAL